MSQISLPEFADKLNEMMQVISREFMKHQSEEFYKVKVTMPQFIILNFLEDQGEPRMTDIANFIHVTTAAMTGIIDRLVRDGYAARIHDPKDRRIVKVKLTPKGDSLVKKINEHRRQTVINLFGKISQKEREDYLEILMHIRDHLK